MEKAARLILFGFVAFSFFFLEGCSTGQVAVDLRTTEGYVDRGKIEVYFTDITGESEEAFRKQLFDVLESHGRFLPQEYGKLPPELPDSLITIPSIVISGHHDTHENSSTYTEKAGDKEKKMKETKEVDEFHYIIKDGVSLEEMDRGTVDYVVVSKEEDTENSFFGSILNGIVKSVGQDLLGITSSRREKTIKELVASLVAHTQVRRVELYKDGDFPELKEGISCIEVEDFPGAIAKFQAAAEKRPKHENVYKAYFNLGIAYEYDFQFEKALVSLRVAHQLNPQERFLREMTHCEFFARRYDWQYRFLQRDVRERNMPNR